MKDSHDSLSGDEGGVPEVDFYLKRSSGMMRPAARSRMHTIRSHNIRQMHAEGLWGAVTCFTNLETELGATEGAGPHSSV